MEVFSTGLGKEDVEVTAAEGGAEVEHVEVFRMEKDCEEGAEEFCMTKCYVIFFEIFDFAGVVCEKNF